MRLKLILYTFLFLLLLKNSQAKQTVKGTIITDKDTLDVEFIVPTLLGDLQIHLIQKSIQYKDSTGFLRSLLPEQAEEIKFTYKDYEYRMLSKEYYYDDIGPNNSRIFLHIIIDGYLKLYHFYYYQHYIENPNHLVNKPKILIKKDENKNNPNYHKPSNVVARKVLQRSDRKIKTPQLMYYKKDMLQYLGHCPTVKEGLKNKRFKKKNINELVEVFNQECKDYFKH